MTALLAIALSLVAVAAPVVVFTDDPLRQSMVLGVYGLLLTSLFFILQAPDVALSMLAVSSVLLPVLVLLALARIRHLQADEEDEE